MTKLIRLLFAFLFASVAFQTANACTCAGSRSACEKYSDAEAVFVGTVTKTLFGPGDMWGGNNVSYVEVNKVYKGKVTRQVRFGWGTSSCDVEMEAGQTWLFYASKRDAASNLWNISGCDGSHVIEPGDGDLKYLESVNRGKPVTRLSGYFTYSGGLPVNNGLIEILGAREKLAIRTDQYGFYETYVLAPGDYTMITALPDNAGSYPVHTSFGTWAPLEPPDSSKKPFSATLRPGGCVETASRVGTGKYIKGTVTSSNGIPVNDVCVEAVKTDAPGFGKPSVRDCVNFRGDFLFDHLPSGKYSLKVYAKGMRRPWAKVRFPTVYYPGTLSSHSAEFVTLGDEYVTDIKITVPASHPLRLLKGTVVYADGSPAEFADIEFFFRDGPENRSLSVETDDKGAFVLSVVKGLRGRLVARGRIYAEEAEKCPKLKKFASAEEFSTTFIDSNSLRLFVDKNRTDLVLRLPYSICPEVENN